MTEAEDIVNDIIRMEQVPDVVTKLQHIKL